MKLLRESKTDNQDFIMVQKRLSPRFKVNGKFIVRAVVAERWRLTDK